MSSYMSNHLRWSWGTISSTGRRLARGHRGGPLTIGRRHEGEIALGDFDGLLVGGGQDVAAAGDGAVHARSPQLLERHFFPHRHLDHARRAHVEARLAVD